MKSRRDIREAEEKEPTKAPEVTPMRLLRAAMGGRKVRWTLKTVLGRSVPTKAGGEEGGTRRESLTLEGISSEVLQLVKRQQCLSHC